jgi:hypothetical protein
MIDSTFSTSYILSALIIKIHSFFVAEVNRRHRDKAAGLPFQQGLTTPTIGSDLNRLSLAASSMGQPWMHIVIWSQHSCLSTMGALMILALFGALWGQISLQSPHLFDQYFIRHGSQYFLFLYPILPPISFPLHY